MQTRGKKGSVFESILGDMHYIRSLSEWAVKQIYGEEEKSVIDFYTNGPKENKMTIGVHIDNFSSKARTRVCIYNCA